MSKAFLPQTRVPGAARAYDDPKALYPIPLVDRKGRPIWNMPKPSGYHSVTVVNKHGRHESVVPIYRGTSAKLYRQAKSKFKRMQRLQAAQGFADQVADLVEKADGEEG